MVNMEHIRPPTVPKTWILPRDVVDLVEPPRQWQNLRSYDVDIPPIVRLSDCWNYGTSRMFDIIAKGKERVGRERWHYQGLRDGSYTLSRVMKDCDDVVVFGFEARYNPQNAVEQLVAWTTGGMKARITPKDGRQAPMLAGEVTPFSGYDQGPNSFIVERNFRDLDPQQVELYRDGALQAEVLIAYYPVEGKRHLPRSLTEYAYQPSVHGSVEKRLIFRTTYSYPGYREHKGFTGDASSKVTQLVTDNYYARTEGVLATAYYRFHLRYDGKQGWVLQGVPYAKFDQDRNRLFAHQGKVLHNLHPSEYEEIKNLLNSTSRIQQRRGSKLLGEYYDRFCKERELK